LQPLEMLLDLLLVYLPLKLRAVPRLATRWRGLPLQLIESLLLLLSFLISLELSDLLLPAELFKPLLLTRLGLLFPDLIRHILSRRHLQHKHNCENYYHQHRQVTSGGAFFRLYIS
jgi:hypothetical protein